MDKVREILLSIVIAESFLVGMVYGLFLRLPSPSVRCDGGDESVNTGKSYLHVETKIDKYLEDLTSDRSADA